jgi:hypothetical protein
MTVKFNDLAPIPSLQDDDLIVAHDISEGVTGRSTIGSLKDKLITTDFITDNVEDIIEAINNYPLNGNDTQQTRASVLRLSEDDKRFFYGEHFLDWNNTTNKPIIPLRIQDLENPSREDGGYLSFESDNAGGGRVVVTERIRLVNPDGTPSVFTQAGSPREVSTDNIPQGSNNLYFSTEKVDERVKAIFPEEFNKLSPRFDKAFSVDSLSETPGTWLGTTGESKTIFVVDKDSLLINSYREGDAVRVYGAGQASNVQIADAPPENSFTLTVSGFIFTENVTDDPPDDAQASTKAVFEYQVAAFDLKTGEISPARSSNALRRAIYMSKELYESFGEGTQVSVFDVFNAENFLSLNFFNIDERQGLLIYRRVDDEEFRLIYVVGPKEKARSNFIDYYNFDNGIWTEKRERDNAFLLNGEFRVEDDPNTVVEKDGLMHFPINPPSVSQRGWVDATVEQVLTANVNGVLGFNLVLDKTFTYNTSGSAQKKCWVSHNDTVLINNAITQAGAGAIKSINLNAKTYVVDVLNIPDEFGLVGVPYITKLKKMPWSGYDNANGQINNVLRAKSQRGKSISVSGIDIDGTSNLQFLMPELADNPKNNFIIDLGIGSKGCLFDKVRVDRPIAGGIYARLPTDLKVTGSELTNSGNTDRYQCTPLLADTGENTVITANRFNNFTQYIDISVTDKGIISGNIIANIGSGIFTYGSKFLITNPNTLVGPAGEFLPNPDILNAEYDAVNLELDDAYKSYITGGSGTFKGPALTYQENGEIYDLASGNISRLDYKVFMISKQPDGSEDIWKFGSSTIPNPDGSGDEFPNVTFTPSINQDRSLGQFGFLIPEADVVSMRDIEGDYSYYKLKRLLSDKDKQLIAAGDSPTGINHIGLGWAASYTHDVEMANISRIKTYDVTNNIWKTVEGQGETVVMDPNDDFAVGYVVDVFIPNEEIAQFGEGTQVKMVNHGEIQNGNPPEFGIIESLTENPADGTYQLKISYAGATSIQSGVPGQGTINIIDSFTLAQGRII